MMPWQSHVGRGCCDKMDRPLLAAVPKGRDSNAGARPFGNAAKTAQHAIALTMMRKLLSSLLVAGCLWWFVVPTVARAAIVQKIDDTSVTGDLVGISDGTLTVAQKPARAKRKTQRASGATTMPTSQPATGPTTRPMTIPLSEIVRVVVREPPIKPPPAPTPEPASAADSDPGSTGVLSTVLNVFFGAATGPPAPPTPAQVSAPAPVSVPVPVTPAPPTSQPSSSLHWQARLIGGDVLNGRIDRWRDQTIGFTLTAMDGQTVEFPADHLSELWCPDAAARDRARAVAPEPGPEDVAFVRKDAEVIAVKGLVQGMDADSLQFRYDDQDRKIALGKLVGFIVAQGNRQPPPKFHQRVELDSGDQISGQWTGVNASAVTLQTNWGVPLRLPMRDVYSIDFVDGRLVYLSDLTPAKVEQTPYFGRVMPWRADQALEGGPLRLSDGQYAKGIAMHSRCVLEYQIDGRFERFGAKVGFEQPAGAGGQAAVRLLGDGKVLYENADARGDQPPAILDVDVSGTQRLRLEVDFGKVPEVGARVIWADARLLRAKAAE